MAASPLPSRGPTTERKCYVTPAFSGVSKQKGTKSEVVASPLPSPGPKRGRKCYVTPAFSGVPKKGFKKGPHRASGKKPLKGVLKGGP